jgi:hypothetical protein
MSEQERLATAARSSGDLAGFVPLHRPIRIGPDQGTGSSGVATASLPVRGGEIIALTSLRGIAAMAVVMQHFSATAQLHCLVPMPSLVPHGYLAVDLFFVLSGFIMSYTYLSSFQRNGIRAFGDFLLRRVARIVPASRADLGRSCADSAKRAFSSARRRRRVQAHEQGFTLSMRR